MASDRRKGRIQSQERALLFKEQKLTYRQIAAEMGISEGAAQYLVQSARRRLAESPLLAERLRVRPGWSIDTWNVNNRKLDASGVGMAWSYWPNIPGEVMWADAEGSQITATKGGYLVEAPYVDYRDDHPNPFYRLRPGEKLPTRYAKLYTSDQDVIEDLAMIEQWRHPVTPPAS